MAYLAKVIVAIITVVVLAAPCAAQAPDANRVFRVGLLSESNVESGLQLWRDALRQRGYIEGQNIVFEFLGAGEKFGLLPTLAAELVRRQVDLILTVSTPPAVAVKQITATIPIVTISADPISAGLVKSLARPGGNVTGVYMPLLELGPKRVQLLKEVVPNRTSVAILWNPRNSPVLAQTKPTEAAANSLGIKTSPLEVTNQNDLAPVFQPMLAKRPNGLVVMQDPVLLGAAEKLADSQPRNRFATSY